MTFRCQLAPGGAAVEIHGPDLLAQGRPTVVELVPDEPRVFPVGRLDKDSEGLILLTGCRQSELCRRMDANDLAGSRRVVCWLSQRKST